MSLGPDARSVIDDARDGDEPGPEDAARVRARLARKLTVAAAAGTAATVGAKSAVGAGSLSVAAKLAVAVVVAGALATGVEVFREPARSAPVPSVAPLVPAAPVVSIAPVVAPTADPPAPPSVPATVSREAPSIPPSPATSARPHVAPGRIATTSAPSVAIVPKAVREPGATRSFEAAVPREAPAAAPAPPSVVTADTVREEAVILHAAERALAAHDGATALARLDEHATRFPRGALVEERAAAHVLALCAVGRVAEARTEAQSFLAARPRSPLAERMRESCAKD